MASPAFVSTLALDAAQTQYNKKAAAYEELASASAYIIAHLNQQLAICQAKVRDYDALMERVNEQEWAFQNVAAWRVENEHLWRVIEAMDKELKTHEQFRATRLNESALP